MNTIKKSSKLWFALTLIGIACITTLGPEEKTLGSNVRIVYLHGAWVWAALIAFLAAGLTGLAGLFARQEKIQRWSIALARTGLLFWITYLPISMWAMQTNWNGIFLAEPRFRLAVVFSITGLLLQAGVTLIDNPVWASGANILFSGALFLTLQSAQNVMHPPAPILNSEAQIIRLFFIVLLALVLLAAWQVARWLFSVDSPTLSRTNPNQPQLNQ